MSKSESAKKPVLAAPTVPEAPKSRLKDAHGNIVSSLSVTEEECLYRVIDNYEDLALFKLALNTGIRREDIVRIEAGLVDLDNRTIKFWQEKKNNWHTVPIAQNILPDITRYINSLPKGQKKLFDITGKTAYNRLQHYIKKAGIPKKLAFHDLRRTFVKNAKKKGLSVKAVAQITDDKYQTIETIYATLDMEELKEEADKL